MHDKRDLVVSLGGYVLFVALAVFLIVEVMKHY